MASLADKNLPQAAQDEINRITADAQAGKISWSDANAAANKVRQDNGADYTVSAKGTTTFDDNSTISSYKTGSQTSDGKAKDFIDEWNNNADVSFDKNDYFTPVNTAQQGLKAFPTNTALAGKLIEYDTPYGVQYVKYDNTGKPIKMYRTDEDPAPERYTTMHANDSAWHQAAYQAAMMGEWDAVGQYLSKISDTFGKVGENDGENPGLDLSAAKMYWGELSRQFDYDAETYTNKRYDAAYGPNAAAVWDATNGAVRTYADLVNIVGAEKAQQMVEGQIATNPSKYQTAGGGTTGGAPATQQFGSDAQTLGASLSANFGNGSGIGNGVVGGGGSYDLSEVIRSQKEAELEAKLANLKGAFNKSEASLNDALAKLPQEFDAARNEIAGQSAIAQRAFDERAVASGLSSGASGQAALARSSVLQKGLAEIAQGQANAASEIELQKALLVAELEAAISEALAQGEAELAAMLYNEMIRVQELEREDALIEAQREAEQNELALKYAAELGLDASSLLGMGSSGGAGATGGVQAQGTATNPTAKQNPEKPAERTVDNGGLPSNAIRKMQAYYGASVDGSWGPESRAKAGNKSATEAWNEYIAAAMPGLEQAVGMNRTATGRVNAIHRLIENGEITEPVAEALLIKFGDM